MRLCVSGMDCVRWMGLVAVAVVAAMGAACSAAQLDSIRGLGNFRPGGLSNVGTVVGMSSAVWLTSNPDVFVQDVVTGERTSLPLALGALANSSPAISPGGTVAYRSGEFAVVWDGKQVIEPGPAPTVKPPLYGYDYRWSSPQAVNDKGSVVGEAYAGGKSTHGFESLVREAWWRPEGGTERANSAFGTFGGWESRAFDVNNHNVVVGQKDNDRWGATAALGYKDLGTLGGRNSIAYAINDQGQVVGASNIHDEASGKYPERDFGTDEAVHAFLYDDETGAMTDLGALEGYKHSLATDVNEAGQIIGYATNGWAYLYHLDSKTGYGAGEVPILIDQGEIINLNDLLPPDSGWMLKSALAINDHGEILGEGTYLGEPQVFLLKLAPPVPAPEPGTLVIVALGVVGLVGRRVLWRRGARG